MVEGDGRRKWGQSPVDIDENNAIGIKFPALIMSGHWSQHGEAKMRNIGSTGEYRSAYDQNQKFFYYRG